ncbi:synaptic vesicle 2-related protein-like [Nymphalis io]|uniref:synaptic vesicle 2-related protein-like n=1 Tax=Inachis io TaxID=171585 RepID=UPI002167777E|nr:synaptic vesicle 2-related protein-like [Nymphalis io]
MALYGKYLKKNPEFFEIYDGRDLTVWSIKSQQREDKVYTYDEAIDLAGTGWYVFGLSVFICLALEGMALDMFGFSVVVSSACDLDITHIQKSLLICMPFLGSIVLAYPWGYFSDTQGRLKGLRLSLWGSFIMASISAFSPNWIVLAVLKFLSSICAYFILSLNFAFDLGFIVFKPWRLLSLILTIPLGVSGVFASYFCESPKFVLNRGNEKAAIKLLKEITEKNGVKVETYPVKRVVLQEITSLRRNDLSLLQSLMDQTFPLFKPPLLYRLLQLFYITMVVYATNNGFYAWFPLVMETFNTGYDTNVTADNMCGLINIYKELNNNDICILSVTEFSVWISLIQSVLYSILIVFVAWLNRWRKTVLIILLSFSFISGAAIPFVPGRILSICLFFGFMISSVCLSIVFSYYVDLFPTSYRGMAACLGVMIARISALAGINVVGSYLVSHCVNSLYSWSAFVLSAVIVSSFLPSDKSKK